MRQAKEQSFPKGTRSQYLIDAKRYIELLDNFKSTVELYGYEQLLLPTLQFREFFEELGEGSDIVNKEMFAIENSSYVLRPETTIPTVIALIDGGYYKNNRELRTYTIANCFRRERPQLGRFREFTQFSLELANSKSRFSQMELLTLLSELIGCSDEIVLLINHIGCTICRSEYTTKFKQYLLQLKTPILQDESFLSRLEKNPLRILDDKRDTVKELLRDAPKISDSRCDSCTREYEEFVSDLDERKIKYHRDEKLVRGLDYYNGLVFEFSDATLGSQSTICAGGRYDRLYSTLSSGRVKLAALGASIGVERLLLSKTREEKRVLSTSFVLLDRSDGLFSINEKYEILSSLRKLGKRAFLDESKMPLQKLIIRYAKLPATVLMLLFSDQKLVIKFLASREELVSDYNTFLKEAKKNQSFLDSSIAENETQAQ